jgi:hypothetical protein
VHIHFAHRTFRWSNEAKGVAAVHCVIIGFGKSKHESPQIFDYHDIAGEPHLRARVEAVQHYRHASKRTATRKLASIPTVFGEDRQPGSDYLLVPRHSSEHRAYIPFGFMPPELIAGDANLVIPNATPFDFGVFSSAMYMAWVRTACGRIKSDYRYTNEIVYNNFPWPIDATKKHRDAISTAAQLRVYWTQETNSPMPHLLDKAVDAAYGPSGGKRTWAAEAERIAFLFELHQKIAA